MSGTCSCLLSWNIGRWPNYHRTFTASYGFISPEPGDSISLSLKTLIANLALLTSSCASQNDHACGPVQVAQLRMGLGNYLSQGTKTLGKSKSQGCEVGVWSSGAAG